MGYVFCQKWYIKGQGVGPRGGAFRYKLSDYRINNSRREIRSHRIFVRRIQLDKGLPLTALVGALLSEKIAPPFSAK